MCIGLLYAMKGEIESMLTEDTPLLQEKAGVSFYRIREDIIACCGGVGKVNAAMATQLFIDLYRPDLILNVGVAGCFEDLPIGTLVLPDRFMQHDMDTSGIGDPVGLISTVNRMDFPTARLEDAKTVLDELGIAYRVGSVATGDWFATECDRARWIAGTFHPLLIEMEGCAAAQVCWRNDVPFLALKSVSDCVLEHHDFYFNFPQAMRDLNKTALPLAQRLLEVRVMERIASFSVDHTVLVPGLYLSRRDGNIVSLDLRFKKPNTGDLLSNAEIHSVEHIIATLLRNSEQKDAVIYFGPFGCQTGFYFLFDEARITISEAIRLLQQTFAAGAVFEGEMPGGSVSECGNCRNLDVALARECCRYYAEVIADWSVEKLAYPTGK